MKYNGRIIDMHTHIHHDAVIEDRAPFLETEPDFKLLYGDPKSSVSSSKGVIEQMDECGVSASVILGFAWRDHSFLVKHNDRIIADAASSEGRLFGFPCIYPFSTHAGEETERCLKSGAAGIGEIGVYDLDLDPEYIDAMAPVMAACRKYEKPIMMHVNEPVGHIYSGKAPMSMKGIYDFVKAYPDNRIILAHWGGGLLFFNSLKKEAGKVLANVWYDSAATPYLYKKSIWKTAVEVVGADKILFGTDYPLLKASRYVAELEESGLDEDVMEQICCRNAENLLGL